MSVGMREHGGALRQATRVLAPARLAWLLPTLLFGLALWLRLYRLEVQPLWLDEGRTWLEVTHTRIGGLILNLMRPSEAYPLYHLLLKPVVRLLGDSEWALRLPSALAGALAVPALWALGRELRGPLPGLGAAALLLIAPFALWQAQDAKAYSLTLLLAILLAWTLARALRLGTRRGWLLFAAVALLAPFAHRLLVFTLVAAVVAWGALQALAAPTRRARRWGGLLLLGGMLLGLALTLALAWSLRVQNAGSQYAAVGPVRALWLTAGQFAVGQWPGAVPRLWLAPFALLTLLGGAWLVRDGVWRRGQGAILVLALGALPTLWFALLLALQPGYEARYFTIVLPFWLLTMAWVLPARPPRQMSGAAARALLGGLLILAALVVQQRALQLPGKGLWSGATVKEDVRGALATLAAHVHPDDLVIVHPDALLPLYHYYAPRVTFQPLPTPVTYPWLGRSEQYGLRELDIEIRRDLESAKRAWLIIAPEHARVVDPPRVAGDHLGLVGLAFQYGDRNRRILCGTPNADQSYAGFVGVLLYCNNIPSVRGAPPQPAVPLDAVFGGHLRLRGYSLLPFATGIRAGGTLPLSLFWQPLESLADTDYVVFVHLTRPDDPTPLAQFDGRPMEGGLPTRLWTDPGALLHDDRTIALPADLPPGRYVLRLGVYRAADGTRLPIRAADRQVEDRTLILDTVEVRPAPGGERP